MENLFKDTLSLVKTQPKTKIWIDKKQVKVTNDGYFAFGIGRDRKFDVVITSEVNGEKKKFVKKSKKGIIKFRELMVFLRKKLPLLKKCMKESEEKIQ